MASEDFNLFRQPLDSIKLATDNFHDRNLIRSSATSSNVEKPFGILTRLRKCVCLDQCLHNRSQPQDQSLIVYKANVKTIDGSDIFKRDLSITRKKLEEKHIAVRKFIKGDLLKKEFEVLRSLEHENIMPVFGVCDENEENIMSVCGVCDKGNDNVIVYRHEATRFLHTCLAEPTLTWRLRLHICVGIASALKYIHEEKSIIHGNINSSVILLDNKWKAKLFGFEFSLTRNEEGTEDNPTDPGQRNYTTVSSEVYNFGVLLFEIMCGRKENSFAQLVTKNFEDRTLDKIIDPALKNQMDQKSFDKFSKTAYDCLMSEPTGPPSLAQIVIDLNNALDLQRDFVRLQQPLEYIKLATDDFDPYNLIPSPTKNVDNYGRPQDQLKVYKAKVKSADRWDIFIQDLLITKTKLIEKHIAVRKYAEGEKGRVPFMKEFHVLGSLKHKNIMSVCGVCDEEHENIIVYRHEATNFLHTFLKDSNLTWIHRLHICVDIASALKYLHKEKKIIHGNINSSVILLDDNWNAKLFGFEFSLIRNEEGEEDNPTDPEYMGTFGYADPALEQRKYMTNNSDVYSFGVLLFEIMCGKRVGENYLPQRATRSFEEWKLDKIIHHNLRKKMNQNSYDIFAKTAYDCMLREPRDRPSIVQIYDNLKIALNFQRNFETRRKLKIPLENIKKAIHNFDSAVLIGDGGFGSVYKAKLHPYAGYVAIKRIKTKFGREGFNLEIDILGRTEHPNILPLLGFCEEETEMILITEFAINGSLADFLQKKVTFTWERRLEVCLGIARGIHHLHTPKTNHEPTILHRDIKSDNILMYQNWEVKIADFGLSKERHASKIGTLNTDGLVGTSMYIAPECEELHMVSEKSDVYSFGVVLFEILCGAVAYDARFNVAQKSCFPAAGALRYLYKFFGGAAADDRGFNFYKDNGLPAAALEYFKKKKQIEMVDTLLMETHQNDFTSKKGPDEDSLNTFLALAYSCLKKDPKERCQTMEYAIKELEKALFQATLKVKYEEINLGSQFVGSENLKRGTLSHLGEKKDVLVKNVESRLPASLKEVKIPFNYKHKNILGVIGYGVEEHKHIFVYEDKNFIGSLDQYLHDASLTWTKRLEICIGVAEGLKCLHTNIEDQVVVHGDIKSSSIVVDDKWEAKITNFGCSSIRKNNKFTDLKCVATDIFLFGRLLFEVLSGSQISDEEPFDEQFPDRTVFENIERKIVKKSLDAYNDIVDSCFSNAERLSADKVLKDLRQALDFQVSKKAETGMQVQDPELSLEPSKHKIQFIQDPSSSHLTMDVPDVIPNTLTPQSNIPMVLDTIKDKAALEIHYDDIIRCRETDSLSSGIYQGRNVLFKEVAEAEHSHELNILFNYKHENIISLIGHCDKKVFVYEVKEFKGSLDKYLSDEDLKWTMRLKICIDVAKGLNFLHTGGGGVRQDEVVLHGNIRSSAILLQQNWNAKIANFGDSLIKDKDDKTNTPKIVDDDIKSFGYLMFEILRGSEITDKDLSEEWSVFYGIRDEIVKESSTTFRKIANRCIREGEKPTAFAVLSKLKKALRTQVLLKDKSSRMTPSFMDKKQKTDRNIPQTNVAHEAERSNIESEIQPVDE